MIFCKKKRSKYLPPTHTVDEFNFALGLLNAYLGEQKCDEDKLFIIDFFLDTIKTELLYSLRSEVLLQRKTEPLFVTFPRYYFIGYGERVSVANGEMKQFDLSKDAIFVRAWKSRNLENNFRFNRHRRLGAYHTFIDIACVDNGNHSVTAAIHHKKGEIELPVYDTLKLFPHVHTNGKDWINTFDGKVISPVDNFRTALIYEAAKIKWKVMSRNDSMC